MKKWFFTLVELLIVISIIAILAAMLLPALKKARQKGQEIICRSNEKQIGTAFEMYGGDNNGCAPPYSAAVYAGYDDILWSTWIWPYIYGEKENASLGVPGYKNQYKNHLRRGTVFYCPSWDGKPDTDHTNWYCSYGYNFCFAPGLSGVHFTKSPKNWKALVKPSMISMVMDSSASQAYYGETIYIQRGARHIGNSVNVLYADLHAGTKKYVDIPTNNKDVFWREGDY
ncbi:MAG: hypothetical protein A2017_15265 [Lentisphaerae bacterium GWF2_44_16]|nr:MAG: hypothetical protein A2017_15265 [Lentisphaerae bacterium GWF2_44_16]